MLACLAGRAHAADDAPVRRTLFDHLTTGFELLGQHRDLACETCHVNAIFKGTPRECQACHGVGTSVRATAKPTTHILTSDNCTACHTPVGWSPAVNFSHSEVTGSCASCHYKGSSVGGEGPNHIVTDLDCGLCHSTIGWAGAVFSHDGRTTGCASCHNNVNATGQASTHIPTIPVGDGACEGCHAPTNYTTWKDVTGTPAIHATAAGWACASCHETAQFLGMVPSTSTIAHDSRPSATLDKNHPATGDCGICHDTISFAGVSSLRPANHIPTSAPCAQCHTISGQNSSYSVTGTHEGVTECLSCHAATVANTFANIKIVSTSNTNHFPVGNLDCNGSGCHSTSNLNAGGFHLGAASLTSPILNIAGHTTVAGQVPACASCHQSAPYTGMIASTASAAGDSRPTTLDALHPTAGDCGTCHTTMPTFAGNLTGSSKPANHIPTNAACAQCHAASNNYAAYSVTGTHVGVTGCVSCHGTPPAGGWANVTIVGVGSTNHFPVGNLDCNGSGCHSAGNVSAGGFKIGSANINTPTLSSAGHITVSGQVGACQTCHEAAPYTGMIASTSATAGDSRPDTTLDAIHPTTGDCGNCHVQTPTFATNESTGTKPANHVPTTATCAQCHTTAGNFALYSVTGTHQGVTGCVSCHGSPPAGGWANVTIIGTASTNHMPIGNLDCNGSGCHTTAKVSAGGFRIGSANISVPTLTAAGHTTVAGAVPACASCHESAPYAGMIASTAVMAGDSRPTTLDASHPTAGDCAGCHTTTPTFAGNQTNGAKPANHIPTTAPCAQCHTTPSNYALYSVAGTHQGVTRCLSCHGTPPAGGWANVTIVGIASTNHFPVGNLDCNGSGCHSTTKLTAGGFKIGTANINTPTLSASGHITVSAQVAACQTCHQSAPYTGMIASTSTTAGDSRPNTTLDPNHPATGDCGDCHIQTPTFATNESTGTKPANHIPTTATCAQCHTTAGNFSLYSVTGTHSGVTGCLSCHGPPPAGGWANITIVGASSTNHVPIGSLDCNGSGCHTTAKLTAGGFKIGAASITLPTLTVAGHTTVAGQVPTCANCHESAPYTGMIASTATTAGDSRPTALDALHPTAGDCGACHITTPTFAGNQTNGAKPANHIPTTAPCTQCHNTASNYALYSVTGTHQGVTGCLSCHGTPPAGGWANVTIVGTASTNHIPIGSLDCNGSGCHTTAKLTAGGFKIAAASITMPTLNLAGHTTVAGQVAACTSCHETAPYTGMIASTATTAGDSRPTALDALHPTAGDCAACHTTTPTFAGNQTNGAKPTNHIPTTVPCAQCHTTAGSYSTYSVTGTHQGVTGCLSCHGAPPAGGWANVTIVGTASTNHFPIGNLDCNGSGCHSTTKLTAGGFKIGAANLTLPTLTVAGHATVAGQVAVCTSCHETAPYTGMIASTATAAGDSRPTALDASHPTTGDCGSCHTTTPTFAGNQTNVVKPTNHLPTNAACVQCHTTTGDYALYSVAGTHQGVTECLSCHAATVASAFANIKIVSTSNTNHFPVGNLDCNGSGCHTTAKVTAGGFKIGAASITLPTLTTAGHTTVAGQVAACTSCHETAPYTGMIASTSTVAGDSRPTALDALHPTAGDCGTCHTTTPTFASDMTSGSMPANHIPTSAPCAQCHTTASNYALYSVTATHQGVTGCLSCHGTPPAGGWANVTIVGIASTNHFPIGNLDCNGSGCHTTTKVTAGGFKIGAASLTLPTLTVAGHATVAGQVAACTSCHETAPYTGMIASTSTMAGDSRPNATLDKNHPTTGDCMGCHATTPTFASDQTGNTKPSNHIPTTAACTQCHTTAGNYALYSVAGTHQGVTECLSCHAATVANTFANIRIVSTSSTNHFPVGNLDCNGSGCHGTSNLSAGGFHLGAASITSPILSIAGHTTVAGQVAACTSCHETAPYTGMIASTATTAGDSRPTALDALHPTAGDCAGCHTTTPTFAGNQTSGAKPANHIPTTAPCAQCHTTASNYALYSVTGTHQGVTGCLSCHGTPPAGGWANVTIVGIASTNHFPVGNLDCNGSGCHTTTKVTAGGFKIGTANINTPTLSASGHITVSAQVGACQTCHQSAAYTGMIASTSTVAGDSRPNSTLDPNHPPTGDCGDCHIQTPTFATNESTGTKPTNHIPTTATCAQCHTTAGSFSAYSVVGTHQGVTGCLSCHGTPPAGGWANVVIVGTASTNHMPIGSLDCNGSGCHTTAKVTAGGFKIGAASITIPTLTVAGHATVAGQVATCTSCHETAPYTGMIASTATTAGDSRPTALDALHPTAGDCAGCHTTTPTFAGNQTSGAKPANHIPTTAPCTQCHTTASNYALYSVTGTHQGVTGCLSCHGTPPAGGWANVTIVGAASTNHFPIGSLDCNGSGCHTTAKVTAGGFKIGAASITLPTLTTAGHTTVAGQVAACTSCHETAAYAGMIASTSTVAGDSRPNATLDKNHPTTGDCTGCHTTTPTFAGDQTGNTKPSNHIPTTAACAQCHTTAGNYALYSVTGTHQGVTTCLNCHGSSVAATFANVTIVSSTAVNHIPFGNLDCNGSGCHSASNVNAGGFHLGAASLTSPILGIAGHTTVAGQVPACASCHESAPYVGMIASTSTVAGDSRPNATLDANHPTTGDCGGCHTTTPTFAVDQTSGAKPSNHIPTTAPCTQCHTTAGNNSVYSVTGTHQGVTGCLSCHGTPPAGGWANVTIVGTASTNHFPIGNLDCNGSGCHTTAKVTAGGFKIGTASTTMPTLTAAGHTTVAGQVAACANCHETAPYTGMIASTSTVAGDSRPNTTLDKNHPTAGDCMGCHTTTPTFASDQTGNTKPSNHIPTTAACTQCHTTAGNYTLYSVTGTHQGVTTCLNCHGSAVAATFANVTIVSSTAVNHIPFGNLDCNGSGCHSAANVTAGGFKIGAANISAPTLTTTGHTTVAGQVAACSTCHETAPYAGMIASTSTVAGDSRPNATLDKSHPTTGDCGGCHTTTPTFAVDQTSGAKPANHIPTTAPCAQCHTTAGNYALYSVTGTHQGVTTCLQCHGSSVAATFANVTIVSSTAVNHIPFGNVDCNGSGCHTAGNVTAGGFKIGAANIALPTLTAAGHTTVAGQVAACSTCHETAPYAGMIASTSTVAGDSRPNATLDKNHPATGDCTGCHSTTPTFASDQTGNAKPGNHIPTNAACAQCHTTAGNYALYSVTGTHQGVTTCQNCHGPSVATTFANVTIKSTTGINHIPYGSLDCNGSGCHTTANVTVGGGGFKIGTASITVPTLTVTGHTTVAAQVPACTSCHETAAYVGMIASTSSAAGDSRPNATLDSGHPTTGDCGGCHSRTPTFASNVTGGSKPANHIPTTAACTQCHTTAGNYAAYVMGTTGHTGITKGCATCHAYGLSFANMAPPTLVQPPSGATGHIPSNPPNGTTLNVACELCHSPTNFTTFSGTVMKHVYVTTMTCMSCHELGMKWKTNTGVRLWVRDSASHYPGRDCGGSGCHSSRDKYALRPGSTAAANGALTRAGTSADGTAALAPTVGGFNHARVLGPSCVSCHGPAGGMGKPADHIASSNGCGSCHNTHAWLPVTAMDHTQVQGTCVSCHSGTKARGKATNHIASGNTCESCHTTNAWTPARYDHQALPAHTCRSCHDSVHAMGLPLSHVRTTAQCDVCHGTLGWKPAKMDHTTLTSNCASCHNNNMALGVPAIHMISKLDCASCHSYPDWSVIQFVHAVSAYRGDHKAALSCAACHTSGTDQIPWASPANAGSCAGCHSKDYRPAAHPKTTAGILYTVGELHDCTGACHVYSDATLKTVVRSRLGPYHRSSNVAFKH